MMKGARTWDEIRAELPIEEQEEITRGANELRRAISLQEIREIASRKQAEVEGMTQAGVSRLENRKDWLISSINAYVRGLGGTLKLVADLPNIGQVEIFFDADGRIDATPPAIEAEEPPAKRKHKPAA